MTFTITVPVAKPKDFVSSLYADPAQYSHWMQGLTRVEPVSGEPGKKGAVSRLHFDLNGRKMSMTETIADSRLPDVHVVIFDTNGVHHTTTTRFEAMDANHTRIIAEQQFRFSSFFMKMMGWLMPKAFKTQGTQFLESFKKYAESL